MEDKRSLLHGLSAVLVVLAALLGLVKAFGWVPTLIGVGALSLAGFVGLLLAALVLDRVE